MGRPSVPLGRVTERENRIKEEFHYSQVWMLYRTFKVHAWPLSVDRTAPLLQRSPASRSQAWTGRGWPPHVPVQVCMHTCSRREAEEAVGLPHPGQERALALSGSCQPASTLTA